MERWVTVFVENRKSRAAVQVKRKILSCYCCNNEFISLRFLDISEDSGLRDATLRRHVSVSQHFEGTYYLHFQGWNSVKVLLTPRLLMSYIYGAPSKARNANVVYIWTYVWQR